MKSLAGSWNPRYRVTAEVSWGKNLQSEWPITQVRAGIENDQSKEWRPLFYSVPVP
uniref:Uncharacterized protein n=1 Tax=Anguilla anguilla TaxID=7936 RepID=A0A0E9S6U5_ANGAN